MSSSFKTPLFKVLCLYILALVVFYQFGLDPRLRGGDDLKEKSGLKESLGSSKKNPLIGYQLIEGKVLKPLSKGWVISSDKEQILLTSKKPDDIISENLIPGSAVILWARESKSSPYPIPGLFSWQDYLKKEGIGRHFILDRKKDLKVLSAPKGPLTFIYRYHEKLLINIRKRFPEPDVSGLLSGLIVGDKRLLESTLKTSFQKAGVMHLLVVSGLQVSLWAGFVWYLLTRLARCPRKLALLVTLIAIWMFALFVGLNPPVLRSAVMLSVLTLVPLIKRETPTLTRLFLAALAFLAYKPSLIKDASFLLSFGSTFGILLGWERWPPKKEKGLGLIASYAKTLAGTSLFAAYAILPILAYFFHQISIVGPLANMILVPWSGILLVSGLVYFSILDSIPILGGYLAQILNFNCLAFLQAVKFFADFPWATTAVKAWDFGLVGAWVSFGLFWLFQDQAKRRLWLFASFAFLAISLTARALQEQKIFLLSDGRQYQALYLEKGFHSGFYGLSPNNSYFNHQALEFLSSRGHSAMPSPPPLKKSFSFDPANVQSAGFKCGQDMLIFPLSPFPIMGTEEISSKILHCHGSHFL